MTWDGDLVKGNVEREEPLLPDLEWDEEEFEISKVEAMLQDPSLFEESKFCVLESEEFDAACEDNG